MQMSGNDLGGTSSVLARSEISVAEPVDGGRQHARGEAAARNNTAPLGIGMNSNPRIG